MRPEVEPTQQELLQRRLQPPQLRLGWMTFTEFLEWAAANNKPSRPIGYFEHNPSGQAPEPRQRAKLSVPLPRQMSEAETQSLDRLLDVYGKS